MVRWQRYRVGQDTLLVVGFVDGSTTNHDHAEHGPPVFEETADLGPALLDWPTATLLNE